MEKKKTAPDLIEFERKFFQLIAAIVFLHAYEMTSSTKS